MGDQKEKEKMLFNVIFTAGDESIDEDGNINKIKTLERTGKKSGHFKLRMMKKIAFFLNPLLYVILSALYFVYFLYFF